MSQKKEKYARRMEKRMKDLERQTGWLWRTFAEGKIEAEVSDRRVRSARRRAAAAERAAGIWKAVALGAVAALIVVALTAVWFVWAGTADRARDAAEIERATAGPVVQTIQAAAVGR